MKYNIILVHDIQPLHLTSTSWSIIITTFKSLFLDINGNVDPPFFRDNNSELKFKDVVTKLKCIPVQIPDF